MAQQGLSLSLTPKASEWLVEHGYEPQFGARPLRRLIQREILDRLAMELLEGKMPQGSEVKVEVGKEGIVLKKK